MMFNEPKLTKKTLTLIATIPGIVVLLVSNSEQGNLRGNNRRLSASPINLPAIIEDNLADVSRPLGPNETAATPLFWHIPKAGGTTIKDLYSKCYGLVEANHIGGHFEHGRNESLAAFEPWPGRKYVNVDMADPADIARARSMGFAESHIADLVFTSAAFYPSFNLFSPEQQAGMFSILRHPVERAISKFYYLQDASWETHYAPETKGWSIEKYVTSGHHERDWMVRTLVNKMRGEIDEDDLTVAKLFLKKKVLIGLTSKAEESVERFDQYFGFPSDEETKACQHRLMSGGSNSHAHPKVKPGSSGWNAFANFNKFDVRLYEYAVALFEEQSKIFDDGSDGEVI